MDASTLFSFEIYGYTIEMHLFAYILGSTRLFMFATIAPFMGNSVLTGANRLSVVIALYLLLHPLVVSQVPNIFPLTTASMTLGFMLVAKEVFIGFLLGYIAGMIFWTVESAGFLIDNQRGAGQATETDPLSGNQSSPTGSFLFQSMVYVFFATGTFLVFIGLVYTSYTFWPVNEFIPGSFFANKEAATFFGSLLAKLATNFVLIAAPVVLACLFTDISLGLINRFASQLNVYVLAMPIKSGIASFLLILYFAILMSDSAERFQVFSIDVSALRTFMP